MTTASIAVIAAVIIGLLAEFYIRLVIPLRRNKFPRIGAFWAEHGGIFAGIVAGENGAPDYFLIHATPDHELFDIDWNNSVESAQSPINGLTDWSLPNRREARLLEINCHDSFDLDSWYWTSEQSARNGGYAWMQGFGFGDQDVDRKSDKCRARAVRRVFII